ncbi:MAG: radical SAM protein [Acidobacteriota bacterium]|nr:radical SAM protein [Acidobacteriota bacterium]
MRISSFLIGAPLPKQPFYILLHGFTGALDKVPLALGEFFLANRGLECQLGDIPLVSLSAASLAELEQRGYLTTLSHEEERKVLIRVAATLHENDLARSRTGFMFVPTYMCNLRCPYCFQSHDMHVGRDQFSAVMSRERVDHAFAVIDTFQGPGAMARALGLTDAEAPADFGNGQLSEIGLFGGEPLCEATVPIVSYIVEMARKRGREVSAISNGVELNRFVEVMGPGGLCEVQITLDGTAQFHDKRRVGPGFTKTFDIITANIDLALDQGVRISLRTNVDSTNVGQLVALDDFFKQKGWEEDPGFKASAAAVTPEAVHKPLLTLAELVSTTSQLKEEYGCNIESYERYARDTLASCLASDGYPFKRVANCSAETGLLMFDPLGDVYACWEDVGIRERRIATYGTEGIKFIPDMAEMWLTRFPGAIEQCSNCPYALIHSSGCANHARNTSGTIFSSACESFQDYFPRTLAKAYEDFEVMLFASQAVGSELPRREESPHRSAARHDRALSSVFPSPDQAPNGGAMNSPLVQIRGLAQSTPRSRSSAHCGD